MGVKLEDEEIKRDVRRRKEGFSLFIRVQQENLLSLLFFSSLASPVPPPPPSLRPSVRPSSIRELEEADVSFGGALSLLVCLCGCARSPSLPAFPLFFFGCESELMPLLRHAALFAVQGFSSANSTSTAAASGGSTAAQTPQNPGRAQSCGSDDFHVTASESLMD